MILFLVHLAGAAALLIWSVRLIRTAVERAFMPQLRLVLRRSEASRILTAFSGTAAAVLLQSSTAVVLIVAGVAASGGLAAATGLAVLLGADLGSAIAVQILSLRADWLQPLLILVGAALFLRGRGNRMRQAGRIMIGLALVFVSLDMISEATGPLRDNGAVALLVAYLRDDLLSAFVIGAVLAYAVHSSLAAVLMFVAFVAGGILSVPAGAALVLGANLGGAVIPLVLTLSLPAPARQIVVANLALRGGGALLALLALMFLAPDLSLLGNQEHRQILSLHLAFNLALLCIGLPLTGVMARTAALVVPDRQPAGAPAEALLLDPAALEHPDRALACAGRQVLHMMEHIAEMLPPALTLYRSWNDETASLVLRSEDDVDRMHFETKLYLARLQESPLTADQSARAMDLAAVANNLEDAGDRISTNMLEMARRMQTEGLAFSADGWRDLADFHDRVLSNAQLALDVMMSDDADIARQLLEEKDAIRRRERELQERHLGRLHSANTETLATSNLHQETLRALKQVNTAVCFVAYRIAEEAGDLLSSRLTKQDNGDRPPPLTVRKTAIAKNNKEAKA